jgi:Flp pilus assembly pilin Flp
VSISSVARQLSDSRKAGRHSFFSVGISSSAAPPRRPRTRREVKKVLKLIAAIHAMQLRTMREEGQTMAEYGVVLAVITVAVIAALGILSGNIDTAIRRVAGAIQ